MITTAGQPPARKRSRRKEEGSRRAQAQAQARGPTAELLEVHDAPFYPPPCLTKRGPVDRLQHQAGQSRKKKEHKKKQARARKHAARLKALASFRTAVGHPVVLHGPGSQAGDYGAVGVLKGFDEQTGECIVEVTEEWDDKAGRVKARTRTVQVSPACVFLPNHEFMSDRADAAAKKHAEDKLRKQIGRRASRALKETLRQQRAKLQQQNFELDFLIKRDQFEQKHLANASKAAASKAAEAVAAARLQAAQARAKPPAAPAQQHAAPAGAATTTTTTTTTTETTTSANPAGASTKTMTETKTTTRAASAGGKDAAAAQEAAHRDLLLRGAEARRQASSAAQTMRDLLGTCQSRRRLDPAQHTPHTAPATSSANAGMPMAAEPDSATAGASVTTATTTTTTAAATNTTTTSLLSDTGLARSATTNGTDATSSAASYTSAMQATDAFDSAVQTLRDGIASLTERQRILEQSYGVWRGRDPAAGAPTASGGTGGGASSSSSGGGSPAVALSTLEQEQLAMGDAEFRRCLQRAQLIAANVRQTQKEIVAAATGQAPRPAPASYASIGSFQGFRPKGQKYDAFFQPREYLSQMIETLHDYQEALIAEAQVAEANKHAKP